MILQEKAIAYGWLFYVRLPSANSALEVLRAVNRWTANPAVEFAEPDFHYLDARPAGFTTSCVGDPSTTLPGTGNPFEHANWVFNGTWGANLVEAWKLCRGSNSQGVSIAKIAILDDGLDVDHPDPNEDPEDESPHPEIAIFGKGKNFADDAAVGEDGANAQHVHHLDDVPLTSFNESCEYHGTSVAGMAAMVNNTVSGNQVAGIGAAYGSQVIPVRVHNWQLFASTCGKLDLQVSSWVESGIVWAASQSGVRVLNHSWALDSDPDSKIRLAYLDARWEKKVIAFAATGNANLTEVPIPASYDVVHGVGASDILGQRMRIGSFATTTGPELQFVAPGEDIHLIDVRDPTDPQEGEAVRGGQVLGDNWQFSGTSYSAPLVSGVAALVASYNPSLDPRSIEYILCTSSRDLPNWNDELPTDVRPLPTCGLIDAEAALLATESYIFHDDFEEGETGIGVPYQGSIDRWSATEP